MLIGELVKRTGFSRDTIRFYEKKGLISVGRKERRDNNYKEYSGRVLERLHMIRKIKNFGFTLNETAELLEMIEMNTASCSSVSSKVAEKISLIDAKIQELMELKQTMQNILGGGNSCCTPQIPDQNCPALTSDILTDPHGKQ